MSSTREKPELRLDWCSYAAAKYAVEHWHYSGRMPRSKLSHVGVWEDRKFVGSVVFGVGSGGNLGMPYGLSQAYCTELVRVALREHATPVSRIIRIALTLLKKHAPGLRLVVSFADTAHGHIGGIYQACGWLYAGTSGEDRQVFWNGGWRHTRGLRASLGTGVEAQFKARGLWRKTPPKHRYLMPLDDAMRAQIEPLRKPYPKRAPVSGTSGSQPEAGGANPTRTLQADNAARVAIAEAVV